MKGKTLFLASMILLLLTVPAFAAYKVEPLPDGTYEVTLLIRRMLKMFPDW